jgi:phage protein D
MEEIARQGKIIVNWNGKNITEDIARFVSSVSYSDKEEAESDEIILVLDDGEGLWSGDWYPEEGDTVELLMGYPDKLMNCGLFQVDEITISGKPDQIEIRAIAAGITKALRTRNSKAFEEQTLRQIALFFCNKHGLQLVDETGSMLSQINMERKTQEEKTDLAFLTELATEFGFIFSIRGNKLVFTSYFNLDNTDSIKSIDKNQLSNYSIKEKTYDTYASGLISQRDAKTGKVVKWQATEVLETKVTDQELFKGRVENKQQAEAKVKGGLWNKNRFKQAGNLNNMPGDPELVSGVNFDLTGCGNLSGKYHITVSNHNLSGGGAYTTSLEIRKTGSIPKPRQVPKTKKEKKEPYDANDYDFSETSDENNEENTE